MQSPHSDAVFDRFRAESQETQLTASDDIVLTP
jgi:hypothetical protein